MAADAEMDLDDDMYPDESIDDIEADNTYSDYDNIY